MSTRTVRLRPASAGTTPLAPPADANGITVSYRVRFDEGGPDGTARASTLLRYAQDVAWIHSERLGFGREWYAERGLWWVVRAAELVLLRPVSYGTSLAVTTNVAGFRRVWVRRRTEARLPDGSLAMWSHTDWVITDARGRPVAVPPDFPSLFDAPPGRFVPGRVAVPPTPSGARTVRSAARTRELDPLAHLNNAAYLDELEEAVQATGAEGAELVATVPRRVRLEYLVPAEPGAVLVSAAWPDGAAPSGWSWRLADDAGTELARGRVSRVTDDEPEDDA
jgi:acyl-CoA thioesterase FadM